ncbi:hypothetical protein, partial [Rhizobium leguminosarum]|uniref:hypothetical protein n=1 Tax=Rhizobium leguminosarum TaxID=384 RepID=UPI003F9BAEF1
ILAIADPVFNPRTISLASGGPLFLFVDNSWAAAPSVRKARVPGLMQFRAARSAWTVRSRSGTRGRGSAARSLSRAA